MIMSHRVHFSLELTDIYFFQEPRLFKCMFYHLCKQFSKIESDWKTLFSFNAPLLPGIQASHEY